MVDSCCWPPLLYISYAFAGILEPAPGKSRLPVRTWTSTALTFIVKAKTNIEKR